MISRRQIIRAGQAPDQVNTSNHQQQSGSSGASSSSSSRPSSQGQSGHSGHSRSLMRQQQQQHQQVAGNTNKMNHNKNGKMSDSNQQDSSDGYVAASSTNPYDDYALDEERNWRPQKGDPSRRGAHEGPGEPANYRPFDPYSIYSEEEDVWYSEDRLFEVSFFVFVFVLSFLLAAVVEFIQRQQTNRDKTIWWTTMRRPLLALQSSS